MLFRDRAIKRFKVHSCHSFSLGRYHDFSGALQLNLTRTATLGRKLAGRCTEMAVLAGGVNRVKGMDRPHGRNEKVLAVVERWSL